MMEDRTVCLWSANSAIQRSFSHSFWVPFFCSRPKSRSFPMQFQMWITTHHIWSSFLRPWIGRTQERNPKKPRPLSCIITRVLTVTDYYKSSFELLQAKKVQLCKSVVTIWFLIVLSRNVQRLGRNSMNENRNFRCIELHSIPSDLAYGGSSGTRLLLWRVGLEFRQCLVTRS